MRCWARIGFEEYDEIVLVTANVCADAQEGLESFRQMIDLRAADVRVIKRAVAFCLRAEITGVSLVRDVRMEGSIRVLEPPRRTIVSDGTAEDNATPPVADSTVRVHGAPFVIFRATPFDESPYSQSGCVKTTDRRIFDRASLRCRSGCEETRPDRRGRVARA